VVVQSDLFDTLDSVTVCPLTNVDSNAPALRLRLDPSQAPPLDRVSWIAVDEITTVRRNRIGPLLGRLEQADMQRLSGALAVFLGIG
jgi:mRNA interferase MazF